MGPRMRGGVKARGEAGGGGEHGCIQLHQLHRAAEEALDVGGDLSCVVGQVGLGVALAHRYDELIERHGCARQ